MPVYNFVDLSGKRIGRLTVLVRLPNRRGKTMWSCICDCGKSVAILSSSLQCGYTSSCGCLHRQISRTVNTVHGMKGTREYRAWTGMKMRCLNPNVKCFRNYGGRGIKVCDRWLLSFKSFFEDMGPCPIKYSLDRFPDNNGNYEPSNCRWATSRQQNRNRRNSRYLEAFGERRLVTEWLDKSRIASCVLYQGLTNGKSLEQIISERA